MARKYFSKFPIIRYDGYRVRNITSSARLVDKYVNLPYSYDTREVTEGERADSVADSHYGDPYMTWLIYYANRIVDPYYDWHLTEEQLATLVEAKHGSTEEANRRISHFRTNWYDDYRELTPGQFDAMFGDYTSPHSSYWNPTFTSDGRRVVSYVRKQVDYVAATNKIARIGVSNSSFSIGDLVEFYSGGTATGSAEVERASDGYIDVKNLLGSVANGHVVDVYDGSGPTSNVTNYNAASNTQANTWTITNISDEEYVYWSPVTELDVEREKNESVRHVRLVDPRMAVKVADRLEEELADGSGT
jgi:hypothetical protein